MAAILYPATPAFFAPPSPETPFSSISLIVLQTASEKTLVFPSYIESYGLPLAEARKCGALILASDTPFSKEILRGYKNAYFFNPFAPDELADFMQGIIEGKIKKEAVDDIEWENSSDWKKMIEFSMSVIAEEKK